MPKLVKPLSDTELRKSKPKDKQYKLSDGKSLYFIVNTNGSKYFRFDYTYNNKRKSISFGTYPETSLAQARKKRDEAKILLKEGINPSDIKKENKRTSHTFESVTNEWLEVLRTSVIEKTYIKTKSIIENNTKLIRDKEFKRITRIDILDIIKVMENRGVIESASRLLNYIERIYKYAVTYNIVEHNIVADIDKRNILKSKIQTHFPAITKKSDIKKLLEDIENYGKIYRADISTVYALKLAPYVFLRPYNLRFAEWSEIDLENKIWEIPKEKMKTKKDFVIPLSKQVIEIIKEIKPYSFSVSKYLFPSPITNLKPISASTLNHALMRMGYKDVMVSHGFRAMASTILHEKVAEHGFFSDIIELQLAHTERNKVKAAYNRDNKFKYIEERIKLMQWWGNWLSLE